MPTTLEAANWELKQADDLTESVLDLEYDGVDIEEAHNRIDKLAAAVRLLIASLKDVIAFSSGHSCGEPGCKICAANHAISKAEKL